VSEPDLVVHAPRAVLPERARHFDTPEQREHAAHLGMWLFLTSETLLFGALFGVYTGYRLQHSAEFHAAARLNDMTTAIARRGAEGATGWDMVPVLFPRHLDNNQIVFAFGETLAHLHCLETRARAKRAVVDGVHRFVALVDPLAQPPADDSDAEVMDIGQT